MKKKIKKKKSKKKKTRYVNVMTTHVLFGFDAYYRVYEAHIALMWSKLPQKCSIKFHPYNKRILDTKRAQLKNTNSLRLIHMYVQCTLMSDFQFDLIYRLQGETPLVCVN